MSAVLTLDLDTTETLNTLVERCKLQKQLDGVHFYKFKLRSNIKHKIHALNVKMGSM